MLDNLPTTSDSAEDSTLEGEQLYCSKTQEFFQGGAETPHSKKPCLSRAFCQVRHCVMKLYERIVYCYFNHSLYVTLILPLFTATVRNSEEFY